MAPGPWIITLYALVRLMPITFLTASTFSNTIVSVVFGPCNRFACVVLIADEAKPVLAHRIAAGNSIFIVSCWRCTKAWTIHI
jgi:hypothetical protein